MLPLLILVPLSVVNASIIFANWKIHSSHQGIETGRTSLIYENQLKIKIDDDYLRVSGSSGQACVLLFDCNGDLVYSSHNHIFEPKLEYEMRLVIAADSHCDVARYADLRKSIAEATLCSDLMIPVDDDEVELQSLERTNRHDDDDGDMHEVEINDDEQEFLVSEERPRPRNSLPRIGLGVDLIGLYFTVALIVLVLFGLLGWYVSSLLQPPSSVEEWIVACCDRDCAVNRNLNQSNAWLQELFDYCFPNHTAGRCVSTSATAPSQSLRNCNFTS